jgi:hypothetical protein
MVREGEPSKGGVRPPHSKARPPASIHRRSHLVNKILDNTVNLDYPLVLALRLEVPGPCPPGRDGAIRGAGKLDVFARNLDQTEKAREGAEATKSSRCG